jgi:L-threonylcarbamoyladenylate synthase
VSDRPEIIAVDAANPDAATIARAAAVIQRGGLVGMPTETVYGLAGNALDPDAVARIYAAKGRPRMNPLIVHVASARQAQELAAQWPMMAEELAARFWPGPLTLILRRKAIVPDSITAGLDTFGVRVPDHPVALALIKASFAPLAAPSANRYTEVSPVTAQQVARGLGGAVDLILDAGRTRVGIESTVVDVSGGTPVILRPGMIAREAIEAVVGPTGRSSTPVRGADVAHPSPGLSRRHYAPQALVTLVPHDEMPERLEQLAHASRVDPHRRVGVIFCQTRFPRHAAWQFGAALGDDPALYAAALYDALHQADEGGCEELFIELPPATPAWDAIHDRLRRAAAS